MVKTFNLKCNYRKSNSNFFQLQQKYPLYTDTAKSCYVRSIDKIKAKDPVHRPHSTMFRRDSRFTCRLSDPLDNHVPVEPGHFAYV